MKNLYKFSLCIIVGLIIILFINQFKDFNKKRMLLHQRQHPLIKVKIIKILLTLIWKLSLNLKTLMII